MNQEGLGRPMRSYWIWIVAVLLLGTLATWLLVRSRAQTMPKLSLAMVTFPGYAPLYLAQEKGFFEGIDVELNRIESIGDIRAAMRSGTINMYAATYDIYQSTKGTDPVGIGFLAVDESHGADGIAADPSITSAADLRGKRVGAEPGFPPYMILQYLLDREGMTLADVNFQDMTTIDAGSAFAAGQLDAAGIYEPGLSSSIASRTGSKVLASSKDTSGLIQDLIFADENLINEQPEALRKFAAGWFKALDYIQTNRAEAFEIMAKAYDVTPQEMEEFQTGVTWTGASTNAQLFDLANPASAYATYDTVCSILKNNGDTDRCLKGSDRLTDAIIATFR